MFGFPLFSSLSTLKLCSLVECCCFEWPYNLCKTSNRTNASCAAGKLSDRHSSPETPWNESPVLLCTSPCFPLRCLNLTSFLNLFSAFFPRTPGKGKKVCYYHTSLLDFTIIRYLYQNCDLISPVLLIPNLIPIYRDQVTYSYGKSKTTRLQPHLS